MTIKHSRLPRFMGCVGSIIALVVALGACGGSSGGGGGGGAGGTGTTTHSETGGGGPYAGLPACGGQTSLCASFRLDPPLEDQAMTGQATMIGKVTAILPAVTFPQCASSTRILVQDPTTNTEHTLDLAIDGLPSAPAMGDTIEITYATWSDEFTGETREMTIEKGGALVLYALDDYNGGYTLPPGLTVAGGETLCYSEGDEFCGETQSSLIVSAGGASATIAPGGSADVGSYHVALSENVNLIDNGACDWTGPLTLAVWPAP